MHSRHWPPVYTPPLASLPKTSCVHVGCDILRSDHQLILSLAANNGIVSHIIQHAFRETAALIRNKKLSYADGDSDRFIEWLCKRTYTEYPTEAAAQDVAGRASGTHERVADATTIPAVARENHAGVVGSKGDEGRKPRGKSPGTKKVS